MKARTKGFWLTVLAALGLAAILQGSSAAQQPPPIDWRAMAAECEDQLFNVSKALARAQEYRSMAVAGTTADKAQTRLLAISQTEDRIATLITKGEPFKLNGKTFDPKTGKFTEPADGKGK